jgi:hypothetical protein
MAAWSSYRADADPRPRTARSRAARELRARAHPHRLPTAGRHLRRSETTAAPSWKSSAALHASRRLPGRPARSTRFSSPTPTICCASTSAWPSGGPGWSTSTPCRAGKTWPAARSAWNNATASSTSCGVPRARAEPDLLGGLPERGPRRRISQCQDHRLSERPGVRLPAEPARPVHVVAGITHGAGPGRAAGAEDCRPVPREAGDRGVQGVVGRLLAQDIAVGPETL